MRIRISWDKAEAFAVLNDTSTAKKVFDGLPCSSTADTLGEEVYFTIPVRAKIKPDAQQVVPPGTICIWVQGRSLAIPFGPTPISRGDECRLVTKVNVPGKLEGDSRVLKSVQDGDEIRVAVASFPS